MANFLDVSFKGENCHKRKGSTEVKRLNQGKKRRPGTKRGSLGYYARVANNEPVEQEEQQVSSTPADRTRARVKRLYSSSPGMPRITPRFRRLI